MKTKDLSGKRILAVHAHPDDEVLFGGGTLADCAARGADVVVITATLGEDGEIIGDPYQGLAEHDLLGGFRASELADSLRALGARGIQLGGFGHFRDSGMAGSPSHENPRALVNRIDEAVNLLEFNLRDLKPDVILTYGPDGGYGHPDHIAVHQAVHAAAGPDQRIWWPVFERAAHYAALETLTPPADWEKPSRDYLDNFTNEGCDLEVALDDDAIIAKRCAMYAHATQLWLGDGSLSEVNPEARQVGVAKPELAPTGWVMSNRYLMPLLRKEHFQLGQGSGTESLVAP